jgi:hypothetical protein
VTCNGDPVRRIQQHLPSSSDCAHRAIVSTAAAHSSNRPSFPRRRMSKDVSETYECARDSRTVAQILPSKAPRKPQTVLDVAFIRHARCLLAAQ